MINSVQQTQENSERAGSVSVFTAAGGAFCNKYVIISLVSVVLAAAALLIGSENLYCIADVSAYRSCNVADTVFDAQKIRYQQENDA